MRSAFHEELDALPARLAEMAGLARDAMADGSAALVDADLRLAEKVISGDAQIDELKTRVQESASELLACQQPVAGDLRAVMTALRMSVDLERMGDLAVHLAQAARRRHPDPVVPPELRATVVEMAEVADLLVAKAGRVIAARDVGMAMELDADDDRMDQLHRQVLEVLLSGRWEHGIETAVDVTLAGRYFERFADHAVQLAEDVVFVETGQYRADITDDLAP